VKVLFFFCFLSALAWAQSTKSSDQDPEHKTVFRNDYLLVLHVNLPPGGSTGMHTHSRDAMAVRLSEAQIKVKEPGKDPKGPNAMHPGDVSANDYAKQPYTHQVINDGKTNFSVYDIEILKRPDGPETKPIAPVAAENASMRAYRWELAPGQSSAQHTHERPYLVVATMPMDLQMTGSDGQSNSHAVKAGDLHWVDQTVTHSLTNKGNEKGVIVEVELQ
jgi:quercetin dioxygenase-like cupin family protein